MGTAVETAIGSQATPAAEMISGGQIVAKMLKQEGIGHIFTISGGHIVDIYNGCIDEGIQIIDVRHEQVAAHAADAYARITGMGCAVVTAGPGTTGTYAQLKYDRATVLSWGTSGSTLPVRIEGRFLDGRYFSGDTTITIH